MAGRRRSVAIVVDPISCDAFGYCAEILPELVARDEWGYPVVRGEPVPEWMLERARDAARLCPRRAVHLRTLNERR